MTGLDTRTIYTIVPDYAGAYGWKKSGDYEGSSQLGPNHADISGWSGEHPISEKLQHEFACWQAQFEKEISFHTEDNHAFDWNSFHTTGMILAKRLKVELGDSARVFYRKPREDPSYIRAQEWEVMENGDVLERSFRLEPAR